eukprot:CAMPEP_0115170696 /NCGR_PEP_ID=MMETSP0270-20121206/1922_1 /TAXON_ID=71861 /ORGANISM="Scrippsiella trochoidea, Strain CCMP3099" /LENGTH=51 /DNA_ID=CAMNT_0002583443 /DNA_START=135 /DNA_END=290 /DNA_ORIENTATION=-
MTRTPTPGELTLQHTWTLACNAWAVPSSQSKGSFVQNYVRIHDTAKLARRG